MLALLHPISTVCDTSCRWYSLLLATSTHNRIRCL